MKEAGNTKARPLALTAALTFALCGWPAAQIVPGDAVIGGNPTLPSPAFLFDTFPSGRAWTVQLGTLPGSDGVRLDPLTGDLLFGTLDNTRPGRPHNGELWSARLIYEAGTDSFRSTPPVRRVPTGSSFLSVSPFRGIEFDLDGSVLYTDGGALYRLDRTTGVESVVDDIYLYDPEFSIEIGQSMTSDLDAGRLWMVLADFGVGAPPKPLNARVLEWDLTKPITLGSATVIADLYQAGFSRWPGSITTDGAGALYCSFTDISDIARIDLASGAITLLATGLPNPIRPMVYDRDRDVLLAMEYVFFAPRTIHAIDPNSGSIQHSVSSSFSISAATQMTVHDLLDETTVFPRRPSTATPFAIESTAHGQPGELGVIAWTGVDGLPVGPVLIGLGACDSQGFFRAPPVSVGAGALPAGTTLTVTSARVALATGSVTFGSIESVQIQP